jgi:alkylhydroperoxidase family enzyme
MARISFSNVGNTPFQNLLGHNPQVLQSWNKLEQVIFSSDTFSSELKEEVRRTLAYLNGCLYCMAKGKPSEYIDDPRVKAAIEFAELFCKKPEGVLDQDIENLQLLFTDSEISELCALISFFSASQKFGAALALTDSCSV